MVSSTPVPHLCHHDDRLAVSDTETHTVGPWVQALLSEAKGAILHQLQNKKARENEKTTVTVVLHVSNKTRLIKRLTVSEGFFSISLTTYPTPLRSNTPHVLPPSRTSIRSTSQSPPRSLPSTNSVASSSILRFEVKSQRPVGLADPPAPSTLLSFESSTQSAPLPSWALYRSVRVAQPPLLKSGFTAKTTHTGNTSVVKLHVPQNASPTTDRLC